MAVHCVVFELRRERSAYERFFAYLEGEPSAAVGNCCRLLFSRHSPQAVQDYLRNFLYDGDLLLVVESTNHWALGPGQEETDWLRGLQPVDPLGGHFQRH